MFDTIYEYLCENQLLTHNQSGFRPGDSTINQLLSITHKIYSAFDEIPSRETRAVFLDTFKAFDKVWYGGLLFKFKRYGISGQRLFKQSSTTSCLEWEEFNFVPYGSIHTIHLLDPIILLAFVSAHRNVDSRH